jgi:pilus assembly protein CpaE
MESYPILLVASTAEIEIALGEAVGHPQAVHAVPDVVTARAALSKGKPAVGVVAVTPATAADAMSLIRDLAEHGVAVVVHAIRKDPDLILAAMRAGAREFVVAGEERQLEKVVQTLLEASGAVKLGGITAVVPAKGGMGATVLAAHLAGALHRGTQRVCLLDLDLELGDVLTYLDLSGTYSLADVAANTRRLDRELLDASVPRHKSGVCVLSQSEKITEADRIGPEGVLQVLRFLRHHYDHLVLDGLRGFGDVELAALDLADRILLVVTQEVPAVRNAQRRAELLRQLGHDTSRVMLVVNRYQKGSPITRQVIEDTVKLPVVATVANDFQSLSRAVNQGVLVFEEARRSAFARDVEGLARSVEGRGPPKPRGSFLELILPSRMTSHGAQ